MFGTCTDPSDEQEISFCCHIDDVSNEIDDFELYENDAGDESIDFIWDEGTTDEANLRPTRSSPGGRLTHSTTRPT